MSYQALYRKYRPSTLEDLIGQDVVIKILKNAIINDKIGHAYLFSGPRGIGKTSIAKVLAKTVNCLDQKDGLSCEKCDNCISINANSCPDIIEIDAASNNGVDEIREIRNKINLVPNQLKYKVYIVDEVHMLTIGAFNALLKTLEEPPEHVIFILATTDIQKVPSTIISRCQCFDFHRISNENIVKRLEYIVEKEKIKINSDVLYRIAELSDGGLRDAVGMLDKLTAYSNDKITIEDFETVNGIVSNSDKLKFIEYLHNNEVVEIINFIDQIYDSGKDLILFVQDLLKICKDNCIDYYVNNKQIDINFNLTLSNKLNDIYKIIKTSIDVKTILEINLLSFINEIIPTLTLKEVETSIQKETKNQIENEDIENVKEQEHIDLEKANISQEIIVDNSDKLKVNEQIVNNCFAKASRDTKKEFEMKFNKISEYALDSKLGAAASFISDGTVRAVSDSEVVLSFNYDSMVERGFNLLNNINTLFLKVFDKEYDIALLSDEKWNIEKQKFIDNKNKGITYEYKPIEKPKKVKKETKQKENNIASQAINLFGDDMISIN